MPFTHVEPLVDAAIASLRANLNDAIDAINAERNDAFELEHVPDDAYAPGGLGRPPTSWPVCEIAPPDTLLTNASNAQAAWDSETTMIVAFWHRHVDDETLFRHQIRYGEALLQVLMTLDAFGPEQYVERCRVTRRRRNPEAGPAEQLTAFTILALQVKGYETPL